MRHRPSTSSGVQHGAALAALLLAALHLPPSLPAGEGEPDGGENPLPTVRFILGEARGKPGEVVTVTLQMETSSPLKAVSVALNFDESVLRVEEVAREASPEAPPLVDGLIDTKLDNRNDVPGDQTTEGWIHIRLDASSRAGDLLWPEGMPFPLYRIRFRILEDAAPGFSGVTFMSVGPVEILDEDVILENTFEEKSPGPADAAPVARDNLVDGGIFILGLGEIGFFLRGDVTFDLVRDISDPISTLQHLFLGTALPPCEDAADSNDDGVVDVSDPVFTLLWLYASGNPLPDPNEWGPDPTPDDLCCEETGGCS
ncbi:MAG TPA: cohesin domain-containing protein [Planctomycetota bacterium]|nr:cohesin domain-containing protein [Planctomycetota bacterium]